VALHGKVACSATAAKDLYKYSSKYEFLDKFVRTPRETNLQTIALVCRVGVSVLWLIKIPYREIPRRLFEYLVMGAKELVVLTGATGFLGFKILTVALKAGYRVRCVVRSQSKIENILSTPSIKALNPSNEQLSWVTVLDMTVPGAYDEAVQGATYVIHAASPIPSFGDEAPTPEAYETHFVQAARKGTIGMLESIRKAGGVKRIVITSSIVALVPFYYFLGEGDDKIFNADSRIPLAPGPYTLEFEAYSASKVAALNESEAWIKDSQPNFDLITIFPGWIFGRDELSTTAENFESGSTNSVLLGILKGSQSEIPYLGNTVFLDDVADLHVKALEPNIEGNQAFVATSEGVDGIIWETGIDIIKKHFSEAIADGRLKTTGKQPTVTVRVDAKKTEDVFGIKLKGYEQQIQAVVRQYLEVTK
jgi:nucleoside-diphosphate-sugar epimerase